MRSSFLFLSFFGILMSCATSFAQLDSRAQGQSPWTNANVEDDSIDESEFFDAFDNVPDSNSSDPLPLRLTSANQPYIEDSKLEESKEGFDELKQPYIEESKGGFEELNFQDGPFLNESQQTAGNMGSWMTDMADLIRDIPINRLIIPGSHDSATEGIKEGSGIAPDAKQALGVFSFLSQMSGISKMAAPLAVAQDRSIGEQLAGGIRYFDLRVAYEPGKKEFWTVHTFYAQPLKKALEEIRDFLNASGHEKEIVILDFQKLHAMDSQQHADLIQMLRQYLQGVMGKKLPKEMLDLGQFLTPGCPIQRFLDYDHRAIVLYGEKKVAHGNSDILWPREGVIDSQWANVSSPSQLFDKLDKIADGRTDAADGRIFVTQAILTPDANAVARNLIGSKDYKSLRTMAKQINPLIADWAQRKRDQGVPMNVVMVDHYDTQPDLVSKLVNMNLGLVPTGNPGLCLATAAGE
jgi:hypothetical protein